MQSLAKAFLALFLAHLWADFVLQTAGLVEQKKRGCLAGYLAHGATHAAAALLVAAGVNPDWLRSFRFLWVVLALTGIHLLLDSCKIALVASSRLPDNAQTFLLDQGLHAATVAVAAAAVAGTPLGDLLARMALLRAHGDRILVVLVVYTAVIFGGGHLVRYLTKPLMKGDSPVAGESADQLRNAGLYIGWLERFLVLTALLLQSPATVGLILTAKSIARYPEMKSVRFAEYFLIGTLLSLATALLGGIVLLKLFHGTVALPK